MQSPRQDEPEFTAEDYVEAETWLLWALTCEVLSNARALSRSISSRVLNVLGRYPEQDEYSRRGRATAKIPINCLDLFVGCPGAAHPACPVGSLRLPGS